MRLNLGCGTAIDRSPEVVNLDAVDLPGVDVVWNVDEVPWPFQDNTFAEVRAIQLFEHVADPYAFMAECHRVLEPGGLLVMATPHWRSENAYTDPTHRRFPTPRTWDYWIPGTALHAQFGYLAGKSLFAAERIATIGEDIQVRLRKVTP